MKNQRLIEQTRLALQILEGDLPYNARISSARAWEPTRNPADGYHLMGCLQSDYPIRIAPQPVRVPLGPRDVPPGSILGIDHAKFGLPPQNGWSAITQVNSRGLTYIGDNGQPVSTTYQNLFESDRIKIQRPGEDWQPCSKPAPESPTSEQP